AGESLRNTYTKQANYTTNPSNTTQSNSIKFFDIPQFSNPEVQQFAEEYAAFARDAAAAAQSGDAAKIQELQAKTVEWTRKIGEINQKLSSDDAQKFTEWVSEINRAVSGM